MLRSLTGKFIFFIVTDFVKCIPVAIRYSIVKCRRCCGYVGLFMCITQVAVVVSNFIIILTSTIMLKWITGGYDLIFIRLQRHWIYFMFFSRKIQRIGIV